MLRNWLWNTDSLIFEPPHDKTNNVVVRPATTRIGLGIRPVWSESLLSAWRKLGSLATHWMHSEDSGQTGRMPRLIWVFAGCTLTLLVLSRGGSFGLQNIKNYCTCKIQQFAEIIDNNWAATSQNQQSDCVPSEDSDQPGHPPSLISLHCALNG